VPGLLITLIVAAYVMWYARSHGVSERNAFKAVGFAKATLAGVWALGMPFVILGGIYTGLFSATESAGVASIYAVLVSRFIYRDVSWRQIWDMAGEAMYRTSQILVIVAAAAVFSWMLTISGSAASAATFIKELTGSPVIVLMAVNVLLLVVGCFLDPVSAILVLTPLLLPIVTQAGVDPVHFGIIMTVNLSIGMFTPPFGLNIFVAQSVLGIPLKTIYAGLGPFIVLQIIALAIVSYVPALSLWATRFVG